MIHTYAQLSKHVENKLHDSYQLKKKTGTACQECGAQAARRLPIDKEGAANAVGTHSLNSHFPRTFISLVHLLQDQHAQLV